MECFCPFLHWCTLTCGDESKVGFGENVSYLFLSEDESGKPIFFSYETVHSFAIGFSTFDIVAQQGYFVNVILCFSPNDIFFIVFILGPNSISTTDHKQWLERPKWPSHERVSKQPLLQTGKWISSSFFQLQYITNSILYLSYISEGGQLQRELKYVEDTLGYGAGSTSELLIQTPVGDQGSVLTPDALLTHLEILRNASKVVVEKHDV